MSDSGILDEIERTRAWCLSMEADRERLEAEVARLGDVMEDYADDIQAARAENARLRAALEDITRIPGFTESDAGVAFVRALAIAEGALLDYPPNPKKETP